MSEEKTIKPLYIEIDINIHCEIKKRAAIRNISIREWVSRAITKSISEEDKYK